MECFAYKGWWNYSSNIHIVWVILPHHGRRNCEFHLSALTRLKTTFFRSFMLWVTWKFCPFCWSYRYSLISHYMILLSLVWSIHIPTRVSWSATTMTVLENAVPFFRRNYRLPGTPGKNLFSLSIMLTCHKIGIAKAFYPGMAFRSFYCSVQNQHFILQSFIGLLFSI